MVSRSVFVATLSLAAFLVGPPWDSVHATAAEGVTYQTHIRKIFREHCGSCHRGSRARAGLDLTSYGGIMQGSSSGSVLAKRYPEDSLIYLTMAHLEEPAMPPGKKKLDDQLIEAVKVWIETGAPEKVEDLPKTDDPERATASPTPDEPSANSTAAPSASDVPPEAHGKMPEKGRTAIRSTDQNLLGVSPVFRGRHPAPVVALAASPAGDLIAVGGQLQVLVYSTESRELVGVLPFPEGEVTRLTFSVDGQSLLGAGGTHADSGKAVLWDMKTGRRIGEYGDEYDIVMAADLSPDGRFVVLGGQDREGKLIDAETGQQLSKITKHTDWLLEASFSPEGFIYTTADRAGNVYVWETEGSLDLHTLRGHRGAVTAIEWSASGDYCITAGEDGSLRVWDMHSGKQQRQWSPHPDGVLAVDIGPNDILFTVGRDKEVRAWTIEGESIGELKLDSLPLQVAAISSDSAVVGLRSGQTILFEPSNPSVLASLEVPADLLTDKLANIVQTVVTPVMKAPQLATNAEMPETALPQTSLAQTETLDSTLASFSRTQKQLNEIAAKIDDAVAQLKQSREEIAKHEQETARLESALKELRESAVESNSQEAAPAGLDNLVAASLESREEVARLISMVASLKRAESLAGDTSKAGENEKDAVALVRIAREKAESALSDVRRTQQSSDAQLSKAAEAGTPRSTSDSSDDIARKERDLALAQDELTKAVAKWKTSQQLLARLRDELSSADSALQRSITEVETIGESLGAATSDRVPAMPNITLSGGTSD